MPKNALFQGHFQCCGVHLVSILESFARKALVLLDRSFSVIFVFLHMRQAKANPAPAAGAGFVL